MIRPLLLALLLLSLPRAALAQAPPDIEGYRFYAFLKLTTVGEEPLARLVRRELPEEPALWPEIEDWVAQQFPQALRGGRERILRADRELRLPMYRRPSPPPAPPPPPPAPEPPAEPIVGALIEAHDAITVQALHGATRRLSAVDNVRRGDTLSSSPRSSASLRLLDGTVILLRPDSSVQLREFRYARADGNAGALDIRLLRGAMRTVSGMIAKDPGSQYRLQTPGGSVQVRGTDYAVRWCPEAGACELDGEAVDSGLYAGVLEGGIDLPHTQGASPANAGDIVRVASPGQAAEPAPEMAALLFTAEELRLLPVKRGPDCRRGPRDSVLISGCGN